MDVQAMLGKVLGTRPVESIEQKKLRRLVRKRRKQRKKVNKEYYDRTGFAETIRKFDLVKRIVAEQDELRENLSSMLDTMRELQRKFKARLAKRALDIESGKLDPNEPIRKRQAKEMEEWLATAPLLIAAYENPETVKIEENSSSSESESNSEDEEMSNDESMSEDEENEDSTDSEDE